MNRIGNLTRLICTLLYVMATHACIYIVACTLNSRLLSGHLGVVAVTLRGSLFPVRIWFGGCATHATPCFVPRYSYFTMCFEKSKRNCLTSYLHNAAILASLFFIRLFKGVLSSEFVDQEQKNVNGNQQKTRLEASKPPTYFTTAIYCRTQALLQYCHL